MTKNFIYNISFGMTGNQEFAICNLLNSFLKEAFDPSFSGVFSSTITKWRWIEWPNSGYFQLNLDGKLRHIIVYQNWNNKMHLSTNCESAEEFIRFLIELCRWKTTHEAELLIEGWRIPLGVCETIAPGTTKEFESKFGTMNFSIYRSSTGHLVPFVK